VRRFDTRWTTLAPSILAIAALLVLAGAPTALAASVPSVESESASHITATDATLEAQINPGGLNTTYRFRLEWGCGISANEACPMYCIAGPEPTCEDRHTASLPSGELEASNEAQTVRLDLNSAGIRLHPETTYRYSVEASNSSGPPVRGPDQTFTTPAAEPPASGPPSIEGDSISHLTPTDATLEAQIDTEGLETTYQFKLWSSPCSHQGSGCELIIDVPLPSGKLLGSFVDQSVSLDLGSAGVTLTPGGEYGYSVTASNAAGSVEGPWHQFEAPLDSAPSIEAESASNITPTNATLDAKINPNGLETSYQFRLEYGCFSTGAACLWIAEQELPAEEISASSEAQNVSVDLNEVGLTLHPGWEYRYSVKATNSAGSVEGRGRMFTTPPEPVAEPLSEPDGASDSHTSTTPHLASSAPTAQHRLHRRRYRYRHRARLHRARPT
jgi:hypothetical protein